MNMSDKKLDLVMTGCSLPVLSVSDTEAVFLRIASANERPRRAVGDQSEARRYDKALMTRLQQTFKPKSPSLSCHSGHNCFETGDAGANRSPGENLSQTSQSSRDSGDVSVDPGLADILILDEIQTKPHHHELASPRLKVYLYSNHIMICFFILFCSDRSSRSRNFCSSGSQRGLEASFLISLDYSHFRAYLKHTWRILRA